MGNKISTGNDNIQVLSPIKLKAFREQIKGTFQYRSGATKPFNAKDK